MSPSFVRTPVHSIVEQHLEDAMHLFANRSKMTKIYDLKFQCNGQGQPLKSAKGWDPAKQMSAKQRLCYEKIKLDKPRGAGEPNLSGVEVESIAPTWTTGTIRTYAI